MLEKSKVKYIQSLGDKKFRDAEGVFVAEGPKIVAELLSAPGIVPVQLYATTAFRASVLPAAAALTTISEKELVRISFLVQPNAVLGVFRRPVFASAAEEDVALVLDDIQDPGNVGTIIRTADWFGISRIYASLHTADAFSPKVVQATMGSIARVEVRYTDLPALFRAEASVAAWAAVPDAAATTPPAGITRGRIVIGNESRGISPDLLALIPGRITIPRRGGAESLNAAVAAGIILSQLGGKQV